MKGSTIRCLVLGFALVPALVAAQSGQVQLSLTETGVTLVAENATPRQILTEWKRVTGATVVGLERLGGEPATLRLEDVPERQALNAVLRATAGRLYVDREQPGSGQSQFDRIVILPTRSKPAESAAPTAAAAAAQVPAHPSQPNAEMDDVTVDEALEEQNAAAESEAEEGAEAAAAAGGSADETAAWGSSPTPVPSPVGPVVGPDQEVETPTSTDFDYANPQKYFQMRAQQMQERLRMQREAGASSAGAGSVSVPGGAGSGGVTVVGGNAGNSRPAQPTTPGGSTAPSATPTTPGQTTPGQTTPNQTTPGQTPGNPYGLPSNVVPGSQAPPAGSPAYQGRYFNPYLPSPQQAGQGGQPGSSNQSGTEKPRSR